MMAKSKKQKPKIKYILGNLPEKEKQEKLDRAYGILFEEVFKKHKIEK